MACSCTCSICGTKFDKYSGLLLNINDKCIDLLRDKPEVVERSGSKHFVFCSDCLTKILGYNSFPHSLMKQQVKRSVTLEFTSNVIYQYRQFIGKKCFITNKALKVLSEEDYKSIVDFLMSVDNKGILPNVTWGQLFKVSRPRPGVELNYCIDPRELSYLF